MEKSSYAPLSSNAVLPSLMSGEGNETPVRPPEKPLNNEDAQSVVQRIEQKIDDKFQQVTPPQPNLLQKTLRIMSIPLSVVAGLQYMRFELRKHWDEHADKHGWYTALDNDLYKMTGIEENNPSADSERNEKIARKPTPKNAYKILRDGKLMQAHEREKVSRLVEWGFGSDSRYENWLSRLSDKKMFLALGPKARGGVLFTGGAAASVALGITLAVSDRNFFAGMVPHRHHASNQGGRNGKG